MQELSQASSRRAFLRESAAGGLGLCIAAGAAPAVGAVGANDRIRIGSIGTGGRGSHHIREFGKRDDVEIVAVCDVDTSHRERAVESVENIFKKKPDAYGDFRRILDRDDIDAVIVVPPDHWHAIPTIMACDAKKDVFVEKPIGHNVREGRLIADAAERNSRIVQLGTQHRGGPHFIQAVDWVKSGKIGKVTQVRTWNCWWADEMFGGQLKRVPDSDPPEGVDYDSWLGPASKRRFNPNRFHGTFYFFWDYSGGMMSAWAVHLLDVVMWAMGYDIRTVSSTGGIYFFDDGREMPDTSAALFECGNYIITYEVRHANRQQIQGTSDHGIEFLGSEGNVLLSRSRAVLQPRDGEEITVPNEGMDEFHVANFLECVRSREKPHADAETGHRASIYGHLANIAYRVGRTIRWDAKKETIPGDSEARKLLRRTYRKPWTL